MSTGADVSWSAVDGADGYEVWRRGLSGEAWARVVAVAADTTRARDVDLGVDTAYVYRVRALDGPIPGRWSEARIARTPLLCLS
jgi:hypothetical protein